MTPLLNIQLQTVSYCAAGCVFCPHSRKREKRFRALRPGRMSDDLYIKILRECARLGVKNIIPYLMADPLSDKDIFRRIQLIKEICGADAYIELSIAPRGLDRDTIAGLLDAPLSMLRISLTGLTEKEVRETMPGVDVDFEKSLGFLFQRLKETKPYKWEIAYLRGVLSPERDREIWDYWDHEKIEVNSWQVTSRAGNLLPVEYNRLKRVVGCLEKRAEHWANVLFDGTVVLCCNDYNADVVLGNVNESSLSDIWNGNKRRQVFRYFEGEEMMEDFLCNHCEWAKREEPGP